MRHNRNFIAAVLVLCTISPYAKADEPVFGYVYTTDLNPKGATQFEQKIDDR